MRSPLSFIDGFAMSGFACLPLWSRGGLTAWCQSVCMTTSLSLLPPSSLILSPSLFFPLPPLGSSVSPELGTAPPSRVAGPGAAGH